MDRERTKVETKPTAGGSSMNIEEARKRLMAKWTTAIPCPTCDVDRTRVNPTLHRDDARTRFLMRLRCHECAMVVRTYELKDEEWMA